MSKLHDNYGVYSQISSGASFPSMLAILFIGLKLTGYIDWSWIWVLSPLWISWILALIFVALIADINSN